MRRLKLSAFRKLYSKGYVVENSKQKSMLTYCVNLIFFFDSVSLNIDRDQGYFTKELSFFFSLNSCFYACK